MFNKFRANYKLDFNILTIIPSNTNELFYFMRTIDYLNKVLRSLSYLDGITYRAATVLYMRFFKLWEKDLPYTLFPFRNISIRIPSPESNIGQSIMVHDEQAYTNGLRP